MNLLVDFMRKKPGRSFRKKLGVFNYKVKDGLKEHKKPGVIPLAIKQRLLKENTYDSIQKIKELEKKSTRLFGTFTRFGNFKFDKNKVPIFNVPELKDFEVF